MKLRVGHIKPFAQGYSKVSILIPVWFIPSPQILPWGHASCPLSTTGALPPVASSKAGVWKWMLMICLLGAKPFCIIIFFFFLRSTTHSFIQSTSLLSAASFYLKQWHLAQEHVFLGMMLAFYLYVFGWISSSNPNECWLVLWIFHSLWHGWLIRPAESYSSECDYIAYLLSQDIFLE